MRLLILLALIVAATVTAQAHHPDRKAKPVYPYFDLIGPLGTHLPSSYRRRYNRPRNIGGKIAYYIAPSSQEAMAWHDATHRGLYKNHRPRMSVHYFYPKPWEALRVGPRPASMIPSDDIDEGETGYSPTYADPPNKAVAEELMPPAVGEAMIGDQELIEP